MPQISNYSAFKQHVQAGVTMVNSESDTPRGITTEPENNPPKRNRIRSERGAVYDEELQQEKLKSTKHKRSKMNQSLTKRKVIFEEDPFATDEEPAPIPSGRPDYTSLRQRGAFSSTPSSGDGSWSADRVPTPPNLLATSQSSTTRFFGGEIDRNTMTENTRGRAPTRSISNQSSTTSGGNGSPLPHPGSNPTSVSSAGSCGLKRRHEDTRSNSRSRTRSLSPGSHNAPPTKTARTSKARTRPKLGDVDQPWRSIIELAIQDYSCKLATVSPFPNPVEEQTLAMDALLRAGRTIGHTIDGEDLFQMGMKLITARDSHMRGDLKDKLTPLVTEFYRFKTPKNEAGLRRNRKLFDLIKTDNRIVYGDFKRRQHLYQGMILQSAINEMWFSETSRKSNKFTEYFNPVPLPTIALIYTTIEFIVSRWSSGQFRKGVSFSEKDYADVYTRHLTNLEELKARSPRHAAKLLRIQTLLYKRALKQSKSVGVDDQPLLNEQDIDGFVNEDGVEGYNTDDSAISGLLSEDESELEDDPAVEDDEEGEEDEDEEDEEE
ncbi:hypothetical protein M422DRAFT_30849 [Sphaerobolus stellatus SS14]|uniref:DUF6532 domain-containing protein n=1 Tax=Sphaerobolus stellatus (strain SS14) TaxID=990650 RepID=A0A0C9V9E4_SPHS4|nr:hypothetical protein M422DRAFT_30849 [Sphaerobolus stellatus SS14]